MIKLRDMPLQQGQIVDIDGEGGRMEVLSLDAEAVVVRFVGCFESEPTQEPKPLRSDLQQALIADLSGIENITHGGATAIWYLCGPARVIFCGMPEVIIPAFQEMGLSRFALITDSISQAQDLIHTLPPVEDEELYDCDADTDKQDLNGITGDSD